MRFWKKNNQNREQQTFAFSDKLRLSSQMQTTMMLNLRTLLKISVLALSVITLSFTEKHVPVEPIHLSESSSSIVWNTPVVNSITANDPTDCDLNNGSIVIDASGDPPLEFSINGGMSWQGSNSFLNLGSGNYDVQVRSGTVCLPAAQEVTLTGPNAPVITDIVTNDPAGCDIQNGVIVISAIDGMGMYQFSIDNGQNWSNQNTFQNLSSGAYQIAVRNMDGSCFVSDGITVLNGSPDEPQIQDIFVGDVQDCGADNGVITIVLGNSSGNFEYSNDNGATWQAANSFTNLTAGIYPVLVRRIDMTCTVTAGNIEVAEPANPVVTNVVSNDPTNCNSFDGSITIEATPGLGFSEYSIDGGISWMQFNTFLDLAAGDYTIAVRNLNGSCLTIGDMITLSVSSAPSIISVLTANPSDCVTDDGQVIIDASPCGTNQLEYSIDGGLTWQSSGTFMNLAAGTYEVLIRNVGETQTVATAPQTLNTLPPNIDQVSSNDPDCQGNGGSITILASGNAGALEFSIDGVNWQALGQFDNVVAGNYTPQVRFPNSLCLSQAAPVTLAQQAGLSIDDVQTVPPTCDISTGSIAIIVVSGLPLEFSIDGGQTYQASNFFPALMPGIYNPAVRLSDGTCETVGDPINLEIAAGPEIQNVSFTNPTACDVNDGSITITASNNGNTIAYSINGGQSFSSTNEFVNLSPGEYTVFVANGDESCPVAYTINPLNLEAPAGGPAIDDIIVQEPSVCGADDASINILASGNPVIQYSIDGGQTFEFTNNFTNLSAGVYDLVLQFPGSPCVTEMTVMVGDVVACTDVLNVTIPMETTTAVCLDSVLQIVGMLTDTEFCDQGNPNTVFAPIIDNNCVSLAAQIGFIGLSPDTICTIHCYDNDPTLCDTTLIVVTVDNGMADCEDVFQVTEITQEFAGNPTQVCVPLPIEDAINLELILNGDLYNNQLMPCMEDSVVLYTYNPLTGNGVDGPYNLNTWTVDGMMFNASFEDVFDLVDSMNVFDPMGMWELDTNGFTIVSLNSSAVYGEMNITHLPTANMTTLQPNYTTIANGTIINVPNLGENELVVINPDNGCADTLTINLTGGNAVTDTITVSTTQNTQLFDICATGDDIPGGAQTLGLLDLPSNGGVVVTGGLCVSYGPNIGFIGKDTFSLLACNNVGQTLCDTTVVIVCVNPPEDILNITLNFDETVDTCLTDLIQLPNGFTSAEICGINNDEVTATLTGDCISIDPVDTFNGTTEICVVHCDAQGICDTTTIVVNVIGLPCPDIFTASFLTVETDSNDPVAVCVPADSATLANFIITIDGMPYDTPLEACIDDNGNPGTIIFLPAEPASYSLLVTNPVDNCADNLNIIVIVNILPPNLDTVFVTTPQNVPIDQICLEGDFPGTATSVGFCGDPMNGLAAVADTCVAYFPAMDFVGNDEFCVAICDDSTPPVCDSFLVVVSVLPPLDTVFVEAPTTLAFDTCLNANVLQLQATITSTDICAIDNDEVSLMLDDNCVTIDVEDSFIGTTEACVIHCFDVIPEICDTTILVITNNNEPPNIIEIETTQNTPSEVFCLDTIDLIGNFDTLLICQNPNNGMLQLDENCFIYTPMPGFLGSDEAEIKICDDQMNCDTFIVLIEVVPLCNGFDFVVDDTVQLVTTDCFEDALYCLEVAPPDFLGNYNVLDNGTPYQGGGFLACNFDTCLNFNYFNLPGMGADGPYTVTNWTIDDTDFSGEFMTIQDLVDSMNIWDSSVNWLLDEDNLSITGCGIQNEYSDIDVEQIASGANATLDAVPDFVPEGTQITLGVGFHELVFINLDNGCSDTLLTDVICDVDSTSCGNNLLVDAEQFLLNCDSTGQFCFDISVFDIQNFVITLNGDSFTDPVQTCTDSPSNIAFNFTEGNYELVLEDTVKACADTFNLTVSCLVFDDVVIDTTLAVDEMIDLCLEDYGFPLSLVDSIVNVCADQATGNVDFAYDDATDCITLLGELEGFDTACYKLYFLDTCATFFINAEVLNACDAGFFTAENFGLGVTDCDAGEADLCLPILPLAFENVIVTVGGAPYNGAFIPCDEEVFTVYDYTGFFPLGGVDPPYIIDSLLINEVSFTGVVNSVQDFADSLNTWNPGCNWMVVEDPSGFVVIGGCEDDEYGSITVTYPLIGQTVSNDGPGIQLIPQGVAIELPIGVGTQEIAFIDTLTGCTDTILATIACVQSDTIPLMIELGAVDTFCLDTMDLVGNLVSISNACPDQSGEFASINLLDAPCFEFTGNEPGVDFGCLVICDDLGICDTTYVEITTFFDGGAPIANSDIVLTGMDQVVAINAICDNDENIDFINEPTIIVEPASGMVEVVVDSSGTCLYSFNYVPEDGFCDDQPIEFQYEICNSIGCDTATVMVTVTCTEITVYTGFSPNGDPNGVNEHFEIRGLNNIDYPGHLVQVYNRWGNRVFETEVYENNPWTGKWDGKDVPDGTYFYLIDLGNGEVLKGYVQVHR